MSADSERLFDDVARALRADAPIDAAVDLRIMAAVRSMPRHGRSAMVLRLMRPRTITMNPLSWGLVAAGGLFVAAVAGATIPGAVRARAARHVAAADDSARMVQFTLVAPNAKTVAVAGDFNHWDPTHPAYQAQNHGGDVWTVTAPIAVGAHEFSFVVDDSLWMADPSAPRVPDNDFGLPKSSIIVGADR